MLKDLSNYIYIYIYIDIVIILKDLNIFLVWGILAFKVVAFSSLNDVAKLKIDKSSFIHIILGETERKFN